MDYHSKLEFNATFHIYNKAVSNNELFVSENDYFFFLKKFDRFIIPIAETFAYCLLPNHFHFLLRIRDFEEIEKNFPEQVKAIRENGELFLSNQFSRLFNSYSKSFNKIHDRKGKLFMLPFNRIKVEDENYFTQLIHYIHRNPVHHGCCNEIIEWKYSSYHAIASDKPTKIKRAQVLEWFGGREMFLENHRQEVAEYKLEQLTLE